MADTTATPEPIIAPEPKAPTPLDPPVVYYNTRWRVPPLVVHTQEEADALDPTEWMPNPPSESAPAEFPAIYYNVNVAPKVVENADEAKALGGDWREFNLSEGVVTAAQAKLDAAKK